MAGFHANYCCVHGCGNNQSDEKFTFFPLPTNVERRAVWLKAIGRNDLLGSEETSDMVCSKHFEKTVMLEMSLQTLMSDAVPSKYLPTSPFLNENPLIYEHDVGISDVGTQTNITYGSDRPEPDVSVEVFGCVLLTNKENDPEIPQVSTVMLDSPIKTEPGVDMDEPENNKRKL